MWDNVFHLQSRLCLVPLGRWCRFRCGDIPPYRVSYGKTYPRVVVQGTNPVCVAVGHVLVEVVYDCKVQLRFLPLDVSKRFFPRDLGRGKYCTLCRFNEVGERSVGDGGGVIVTEWVVVGSTSCDAGVHVPRSIHGSAVMPRDFAKEAYSLSCCSWFFEVAW